MGGYEAAGGRDGSLCDDEIYKTVTASASLGNSGNYTRAVINDGRSGDIYMGGDAQQGGYNGAEMDGPSPRPIRACRLRGCARAGREPRRSSQRRVDKRAAA